MFPQPDRLLADDLGSATAEYAVIAVVAAALAGIFYTVITGESALSALEGLVARAFSVKF